MFGSLSLPELVVMVVAAVVAVIPASRICAKAGYPRWLGALALVPIVNALLVLFLVFATWPIERRLERVRHAGSR